MDAVLICLAAGTKESVMPVRKRKREKVRKTIMQHYAKISLEALGKGGIGTGCRKIVRRLTWNG